NGVGQPVRADCVWLRIIDANTAEGLWGKSKAVDFPKLFNCFASQRCGSWYNTAQSCAVEFGASSERFQLLPCAAAKPIGRGDVSLLHHPAGIGKPQVCVGVADVKKQEHSGWSDGVVDCWINGLLD